VREDADTLLSVILKSSEKKKDDEVTKAFVCGKTRTYFREGSLEFLENKRLYAFGDLATDIQRIVRGFVKRVQYKRLRKAAIVVEAKARSVAARNAYVKLRSATIFVQCWVRVCYSKATLVKLRRDYMTTKIQTRWRITVAMAMLKKQKAAAVKIQACARGAKQRPIYRKALVEAVEEAKLENQLKTLQRKLEEAEEKRVQAEKRAEEKAKTVVVYKEKEATEKESEKKTEQKQEAPATPAPQTPGQLSQQQQTLMDESGKMLEYLRKEVFKLRSSNSQLRTDFDLLKENNQRLMDANASAGASFAALNQHAKQLSKKNAKLESDVSRYKQQSQALHLAQIESKEELKMKQGTYIAEVHSRLQYQKTMQQIVDVIQERCRDHRLVEDVLGLSDECESDYMSGPTGVDFTPTKAGSSINATSSFSSRFKSFFSPE